MEFTPEQQTHIDNLVEDRTNGMYTEDDLNRKITAEVDRRVETGIQRGLETQKSKWEDEYKTKAQLSAEEVVKLEVQEKLDGIAEREKAINIRSNEIDARDLLSNAEIPKEDYSKFMSLLVSDDVDMTTTNVNNFIETFNTTKDNIEKSVKKKLSIVEPPKGDPDVKPNTGVQDFITMANEANIRNQ